MEYKRDYQMMTPPPTLPTEDSHFKVHYPIWIGILLLCIGLAICALTLGSMLQSSSFNSTIIPGAVILVAGYLYLTRPYFALAPNRLTAYNLLGGVIKRYPFETFSHLMIEDGTLYIDGGFLERGRPQPTKLKQWLAKSKDWETLKIIIE